MADEDKNPIESLTPGQILASADVADFIKAMGLSIAEAQKALDVNSLSMLGEYVELRPGLAGADGKPRSLVQLGLSPPFYHYQYADLTVSMQLMMKVGRGSSFGIGGKLDLGLDTNGGRPAASARTAQVKLKKLPASVTAAGTKTDATGADLDAAAAMLAAALRAPAGKFEQVLVNSTRSPVKAELDPGTAKNPLLTPGAVAFLPSGARSSALIRIATAPAPNTTETFILAGNPGVKVAGENDVLTYARKVVSAIKMDGFKARLARDPGDDTASLDAPGVVAIALFDKDSDVLKSTALAELQVAAELLVKGGQPVKVTGYADTRGSNEFNKNLGSRRATKVAEQLKAYNVDASKITIDIERGGEDRWSQATSPADNPQFRRAEVTLVNSREFFVVVESDTKQLQDEPKPDLTGGGNGNGFIVVNKLAALAVDATEVKVGEALTSVAVSGAAVNSTEATFAAQTPEAFAFNLAKAINAGSDSSKVRATRRGAVVLLAATDDAVTLDLVTLSATDFTLVANGGAELSKPLEELKVAGSAASKDKPNVTVAVGLTVDHRTSRQFEQTVNGNSSISARLVAVPAPVEFLDELRSFLSTAKTEGTPSPSPSPSP